MTIRDDIRTTLRSSTPVYAVVGVTDLAVEAVRTATARAREVDLAALQADLQTRAQGAPAAAVTRTLQAAGRAEEAYEGLAARGKQLVGRVQHQQATQDLLAQGRTTLARGRAGATTARKVVEDTLPTVKATLTRGRKDVVTVVADTRTTVATDTGPTKAAAKRAATTARKRTASARTTAKGAGTSARKTASSARKAAGAAAKKVGD